MGEEPTTSDRVDADVDVDAPTEAQRELQESPSGVVKLPLSSITHGESLRVRRIDRQAVQQLEESLRAGSRLPPLLIDSETRELVGGHHRYAAYLELYGEEHEVEVEERRFGGEGERLLAAIADNATHGQPLQQRDRRTCVRRARKLGMEFGQIAEALRVTEAKCVRLHEAALREERRLSGGGKREAPKSKPAEVLLHANALIDRMQHDLVDWENEEVRTTLKKLFRILRVLAS